MAAEDLVEDRPKLDAAPANVERTDLEGYDMVVAGMAEFTQFAFTGLACWRVQCPNSIGDRTPQGRAAKRGARSSSGNIQ
jgi:hypothetical protein